VATPQALLDQVLCACLLPTPLGHDMDSPPPAVLAVSPVPALTLIGPPSTLQRGLRRPLAH
jgi:hypothetical protein